MFVSIYDPESIEKLHAYITGNWNLFTIYFRRIYFYRFYS
jgi:hypothetical protein